MSCPEMYRALVERRVGVTHWPMSIMGLINRVAASVVCGKTRTTAGIEPLYQTSYKRTAKSAPLTGEIGDE